MENKNKINQNDEKIIIENKYQVTKQLFKEWAKENNKYKYFKILWWIVTILSSVSSLEAIINNHIEDAYGILIVAYGLFMIIFGNNYFFIERYYKNLTRFYKKDNWERKIKFFNDYFETIDAEVNQVKFQYNDIINIEKNNERIKIRLNSGYIRIYKNAFEKSNFEECEQFLNKKIKRGKIMDEENIYIPKDMTELLNKMKENGFKGEITLKDGIIYWQIDDGKIFQILFENQPEEAYVILPNGSHDHVPNDELWEYLDSLNNSNGEF